MSRISWDELPEEIQNKILENQEYQGSRRNPEIFKDNIQANFNGKGFDWSEAEGENFWDKIIMRRDFTDFYKLYPKKEKTLNFYNFLV